MAKRKFGPDAIPQVLQTLSCADIERQQTMLRELCPCRSQCYDRDIWAAICRAYDWGAATGRVAEQAHHALTTLVEKARPETEEAELLEWLTTHGHLQLPLRHPGTGDRKPHVEPKPKQRVRSRDLPRLLETLNCGDPDDKQKTLQLLCPCRNVRYDQEVWLAIFRAYESGDTGHVRDQAGHAIGTLRERARTDPRSQKLLMWLAEQGVNALPLDNVIPTWQPTGRAGLDGLYIPRFEHSPRSKSNRRR
jgi:hypothetical protein